MKRLIPHTLSRWIAALLVVLALAAASTLTAEPVNGRRAPGFSGATAWFNSQPLTAADLKGKVVLVDFWTYSCINCLRTLPTMRAWYARYKSAGLVIVGVHTPEFDFEADPAKVERAVKRFGLEYPVALDGRRAIWEAFNNRFWPAHYLIDANGRIRYQNFGEGGEEQEEQWIQKLLSERSKGTAMPAPVARTGSAIEMPADFRSVQSPETYIGYERAQNFVSGAAPVADITLRYTAPKRLSLNEWALSGQWIDHAHSATLVSGAGSILFRFHARDLHLVLGPGKAGKPLRYRVLLDGHAPGADHGADTDAEGYGNVTEDRLYQLVRQHDTDHDHTFEIQFLSPGVEAFSFTFG